jgi:hypothetical protein
MPNYKEQTATATAWQRANEVRISNPANGVPNIVFYEEEAINLPSGIITRNVGNLTESFADPTKTFNLLHPVTGDVIGTAAYQDIYVMLFSLYMALADRRDNPPPPPPPAEEPPPVEEPPPPPPEEPAP